MSVHWKFVSRQFRYSKAADSADLCLPGVYVCVRPIVNCTAHVLLCFFLLRDAMLAQYLLSSCVRLSVCLSVGFLPHIPHCVVRKFEYLLKLRYLALELCPELRT